MNNNISVGILTLGCRVNQYESCAIAERLCERGIAVNKSKQSDYYIVNTCAVTAESERKSRQLVRRCASKGKVLVIGCAAQLDYSYNDIDNVIYVGGNRDKADVVDIICGEIEKAKNSVLPMHGAPYEEMYLCGRDQLFSECRAYIKIQDGCNGKCTYCIIPKCRGSVRSRAAEDIVSEATRLADSGYHEVILTGIEVGAYNKIPLGELIKRVAEVKGISRLRLGSLSPNIINKSFLESIVSCHCFMPHIHLSIQSCCDRVLKAMMRPYRKKDIYERVEAIRRYIPECMISADIIVGFPGETEEEFLETVDTLRELKVFHIHSFPYSERQGTPAAEMANSVPKNIRTERNSRLISACADIKHEILNSMNGRVLTVLVEKIADGYAFGHTNEFLEARFPSTSEKVGDIVDIAIISNDGSVLDGSVIKTEELYERKY